MQSGGISEAKGMQDPSTYCGERNLDAWRLRCFETLTSVRVPSTAPSLVLVLDERKPRRSIYLTSSAVTSPQCYNSLMPGYLHIGHRQESTVALQALAMLNSPFLLDLSQKFATASAKILPKLRLMTP